MNRYTILLTCETDGRWIAEVLGLPGVLAYGCTAVDARSAAKKLIAAVKTEQVSL